MSYSQRVTSTAHSFGEHRPYIHKMAFRHQDADKTPLIIALGLTLLVIAALIWCCLSPILRRTTKRTGANHDPETAVRTESHFYESVPPFTNMNAQHEPSPRQSSKISYNRTRSVASPHAVYDPFELHHGGSRTNHGIGIPQLSEYRGLQPEQNRGLTTLPSLPLYRPDDDLSSSLVEQNLQPPPGYSSRPGSPSNLTPTQASTPPNSDMPARFSGIDQETSYGVSLETCRLWKPAEWKDFPLSVSQPTITEISTTLNRTFSSPERYSASNTVSKSVLCISRTPPLCGIYTIFLDHSGRMVSPRLSIPPEQTTASDSTVTISPCDMVSTAGGLSDTESLPSHSEDRAYEVSSLASEHVASDAIVQPADFDKEPKLTHIHEARQVGTNSMETSA